MLLSLFIGARFSRSKDRNKLVSFISLSSTIGITVGVAVIILGLSVMNGFERELENRILSVVPHAEIEGVEEPINNGHAVMDVAMQHKQVVAGAPYIRFTALLEKGTELKAVEVRGVDPKEEDKVTHLSEFIDSSAWARFQPNEQQIILGKGVAQQLQVKVGESITILIPQTNDNAQKLTAPKRVRLTVVGLLSLGGQVDHGLALLPLEDAQSYLNYGQSISGIALKTTSLFEVEAIMNDLGPSIPFFAYLITWKNKYGFLYNDIQLVRTIMYLVMVLVIGVASFNIVSTLIMAVKDRASDIAILRTMGAKDGLVKRIFIWYGVMSGVLGSLIGSVIGVAMAYHITHIMQALEKLIGHQFLSGDIYFINFLPSQVLWSDVLLVSGTAIGLSLLATWYPASRAANLNPATVLSAK